MYRKILIANRADCAVRLIGACHRMGIEACLVSSLDEPSSIARTLCDDIVYTGISREAYESEDDILEAAIARRCEAILPGWGFLSENAGFARRARLLGIHMIAPSDAHLQLFGDKYATLRTLSSALGVPLNAQLYTDSGLSMSGPCMLKGRFGGGGKSVYRFDDIHQAGSFIQHQHLNSSKYYIEPCIDHARHIEFQVMGNGCHHVRVMGIRDCTAQYHHQKYLELSIGIHDDAELKNLSERIESIFSKMNYIGWGTVEFLRDNAGCIHLLEVNPRLQVEHGVTEMVSGVDLVCQSIELSCRGIWPEMFSNLGLNDNSESMEFRLYARTAGKIEYIGFEHYPWPEYPNPHDEYRLETGYMPGDEISGAYDGLMARFIVKAPRKDGYTKLCEWLKSFRVSGVNHNLDDLLSCGAAYGAFGAKVAPEAVLSAEGAK